ncbi:MAG: hypothetical protein JWN86_4738 [Planctomycetota bacterium]|nr:hypothetical protein [Planctomycetota bacterium]
MTVATRIRPGGVLLAPLRWLERTRGWRRRLLIVLYLFVGMILGVLIWRSTSLNNLPDVGDPFDVEAFVLASRVPESEDAFVLYRKAGESMKIASVTNDWSGLWKAVQGGWAKASPEVKAWVADNRAPLDLWRRGTLRRSGIAENPATIRRFDDTSLSLQLHFMGQAALLEGSRLESEGDRRGALDWYLAVARSCHHLTINSRIPWHDSATSLGQQTRDRMIAWARDPKTDAASLRSAIDVIQALDAKTSPTSDMLKVEYLSLVHSLGDPAGMARASGSAGELGLNYQAMRRWYEAYWFLRREPERGRRVVQLFFANWLAHCDKPVADRPRIVSDQATYPSMGMYKADPTAPFAARAIEPDRLFGWLDSTNVTCRFLTMYPNYVPDAIQEHQSRGVLLVTLAEQLYLRENGKESPSVQALTPKYLKTIPDGYK